MSRHRDRLIIAKPLTHPQHIDCETKILVYHRLFLDSCIALFNIHFPKVRLYPFEILESSFNVLSPAIFKDTGPSLSEVIVQTTMNT